MRPTGSALKGDSWSTCAMAALHGAVALLHGVPPVLEGVLGEVGLALNAVPECGEIELLVGLVLGAVCCVLLPPRLCVRPFCAEPTTSEVLGTGVGGELGIAFAFALAFANPIMVGAGAV
jgi:hypothetical protein